MKTTYKYIFSLMLLLSISSLILAGGNKGGNGNKHAKGNKHTKKKCKVKARFTFQVNGCTVNFTDHSKVRQGDSITKWLWTFGDGTQDTVQNPSHVYLTSGKYWVHLNVTAQDPSGKKTCKDHKRKMVKVKSCTPPPPQCDIDPKFAFKVDSNKVIFTDNSTAGPGTVITKWQWDFGDGKTDTVPNPTHIYSVKGIYNVCLTITGTNAGKTCVETKCDKAELKHKRQGNEAIVSTDIKLFGLMNLYPNPAYTTSTVEFNLYENSPVNVTVIDIQGKTVATLVNDNLLSGTHKVDWAPAGDIPSGIYFVIVKTSNSIEQKQLILEK